jgi:adenine-specific DNA methylase
LVGGQGEPPNLGATEPAFPRTRYQGSKRRLAGFIVEQLKPFSYATVLDAFGGTGAVAYAFKSIGKAVTYNDHLAFNHHVGNALIENDSIRLDDATINGIGCRMKAREYPDFIERTFRGVYFTDEENRWLDTVCTNIGHMADRMKRAMVWFAVFQAALAKRPYNLFHRRNLYMRLAKVDRGFGNKTTWDRSFEDHVRRAAAEANAALIDSDGRCRAVCGDVMEIEPGFDLVYIDPPYLNARGVGVDYRDFYHFLEGMVRYDEWPGMIDEASKHGRLRRMPNEWNDSARIHAKFEGLFERFRSSHLVVSYRSDGIPGIDELTIMLRRMKRYVHVIRASPYQYALSTNRKSQEMVLIGTNERKS